MNDNNIGVILLVYNEEIHLKRCLDNLLLLTSNIYVIDSYSTDNTIDILNEYGISFIQNKFTNQSSQLNFAINNYPFETNWILRVDCDELLSEDLITEMKTSNLLDINSGVSGFYIKRKVKFFNKTLNYFKKFNNCVLVFIKDTNLKSVTQTLKDYKDKGFYKKGKDKLIRNYGIGAQIIKDLKIRNMTLITKSPKKVIGLDGYGIRITKQEII